MAEAVLEKSVNGAAAEPRRRFWKRQLRVIVGGVISFAVLFVALTAPALTRHNPVETSLYSRLKPPAWAPGGQADHPLGTDHLGRDLLARVIYGSRVSLAVGAVAVLLSGTMGVVLGLLAGYFGGWWDHVIMRVTEIQLAFPFLLLAIFVISVLKPSLVNLMIVLAISNWVVYARLVRASTLSLREREYTLAAQAIGARSHQILLRHILPNAFPVILVIATYQVGQMILAESALSFLGLGVPPPTPTWGSIVGEGREYIDVAWWIITFPGLALMVTVVGLGFLGDWLRDRVDPRLRT